MNCGAQSIQQFNPSLTSIEQFDQLNEDGAIVPKTSYEIDNESHAVRNTLVIAALGLTFSLGMAITATTIRQNRPSNPQPTSYYAS
jgi:hypothetical protein